MHLTIEDIKDSKARIDPYIHTTPILSSSLLNEWLGHELFFKCENFQKIGAFKARGGLNTVAWLRETGQGPKQLVANSSGNHAQAVALAGRQFGIPTTIYMPAYSSSVKIQATKGYGAKVVLGKTRDETDAQVQEAAHGKGVYWIPPFNHDQVICGQGTAALEALGELGAVDAVFAPCGGGGLLSGTLIATRGSVPTAKVFGVEPLNANDVAESLRKGTIQRLPSIPDTLADGAMTMEAGNITFEYLKQLDGFFEVEEAKIVYWTQWLTHLLKCRLEPTCALPMQGVVEWLATQKAKRRVLIIISGGNMDRATAQKIWTKDYLDQVPRPIIA